MTLKKMDLDKDGKVSFSDFESTVRVSLYELYKFKRKLVFFYESSEFLNKQNDLIILSFFLKRKILTSQNF